MQRTRKRTHKAGTKRAEKLDAKEIRQAKGKGLRIVTDRVAKESRAPKSKAKDPLDAITYGALLSPTVIVPDSNEEKAFIADAGTIVKRAEQTVFYRDRVSPVTGTADEMLVHYGKSNKVRLGWLARGTKLAPVPGPTFLVQTRDPSTAQGWDAMRLLVSNARAKYHGIGEWLAGNAAVQRSLIREVTTQLGGLITLKQSNEVRARNLLSLIIHTEIEEMPAVKQKETKKVAKGSVKASAKNVDKVSTKKVKKAKSAPKSERSGHSQDEFIIKRLTENGASPFRPGSTKEQEWKLIKKGMTIAQLVEKGGKRGNVNFYVRLGHVKLLRPKASVSADE